MSIREESAPTGRGIILADTGAREMPLPKESRPVANRAEPLGKGRGLVRKDMVRGWRLDDPVPRPELRAIGTVLGDIQPCRCQSRDQRGTRRRADRCRCVRVGEPRTLLSQGVNVGCVQPGSADPTSPCRRS
jgi:hypothetical protein